MKWGINGRQVWDDVAIIGIAGPVTGVTYDDENLTVEQYVWEGGVWTLCPPTDEDWREYGSGLYGLRIVAGAPGGDYTLWRVSYDIEPGITSVCYGAVRSVNPALLDPPDPAWVSEMLCSRATEYIGDLRSSHWGYLREQVPRAELPALDVAASPAASEDTAGYRSWTIGVTMRIAAASTKRQDALNYVSNTARVLVDWVIAQDPTVYNADAFRNFNLELAAAPRGEGAAVREATLRFDIISEG